MRVSFQRWLLTQHTNHEAGCQEHHCKNIGRQPQHDGLDRFRFLGLLTANKRRYNENVSWIRSHKIQNVCRKALMADLMSDSLMELKSKLLEVWNSYTILSHVYLL
jgi:hypothetical protein